MKPNILFLLLIVLICGCAEKEVEPSFSLQDDATEIKLTSDANSETVISFTSTREWQANASSEWLQVSPASGDAGTFQMTVTAISKNTGNTSRTAVVNLVSAGLTRSLTVTQSAAEYVELSQDSYNIGAEGAPLQIQFTTNLGMEELAVYGTADWLTQQADSRASDMYVLNLTVLPNTGRSSRTGYLYFYKETGQEPVLLNVVTIIQDGSGSGTSSDYSSDKTVQVLQRATEGKGLPIVLMGDGFLDTDIEDGTYDKVMDKALENIFTEEPLKSLRNYFNVYSVTAVSPQNRFGYGETAFGCVLEGGMSTFISGDDESVIEYVECVEGIDLAETLAVVILNSSAYAGTTYFGYTIANEMTELAIAYCPVICNLEDESFREVLVHEVVGHGFAKLEDEYS